MGSDHESAALTAEAIASDASGSPKRQRRSRHGCLRCKLRRRKCDLTKPQCQRCAASNVECTYPTGVTFAANKTISEDVQSPSAISPSYSRLKFLEPGSRRKARSKPQERHTSTFATQHKASPVAAKDEATKTELPMPPLARRPSDIPCANVSSPTSVYSHGVGIFEVVPETDEVFASSYVTSPNTTDYETALEVLVSLGGATDTIQEEPQAALSFEGRHSQTSSIVDVAGLDALRQRLDDMKILQLLTNYRYHVAPWLDICDQEQTFGLVVPRLAVQSDRVCSSLVSLTLSLSANINVPEMAIGHLPLPQTSSSLLDEFVADTMDRARQFVTSLPLDWPRLMVQDAARIAQALHKGHVWRQAGCLRLRLLLSAALASGGPMLAGQDIQYIRPLTNNSGIHNMCDSTLEILILCARSINISSSTTFHTSLSGSPAQSWQNQAQALQAWYDARCQTFRPLLDIDLPASNSTTALFPTIVFSTPAAILANSVYHVAMLLLLRHKPRTIPALSSCSSPLWHARRVCGIAIANAANTRDQCLLSALYVAARYMTYAPQQARIVRCFGDVGARTGWRELAEWFVGELQKIWTPI